MKIILITFGLISLSLGILGVFLPILPTTPFVLLSTYLLSKSSIRLNNSITNSKIYQKYFKTLIEKKEMSKSKKWLLLISVDFMLFISFLKIDIIIVRIMIISLILFKHYYFYKYMKVSPKNV